MNAPPKEPQVPRRTFEALFNEGGFAVDEDLKAGLRAISVDLDALRPTYSLGLMRRAFEVVRAHCVPHLPADEGMRELGRRWVAGFRQTPIGFVFRSTAPLFGPDRTLQTLPRYMSAAREDMPLRVIAEGDRRYRVLCEDPDANAWFLAGCIEGVLETCRAKDFRVVVKTGAPGVELEVSLG